jgi:hypothetical protein
LQLLALPILAGNRFAATGGSAVACHSVIVKVSHSPIVRQLFLGFDIAHGDEDYLPLDTKVRIAGMIAEYH